MKRGLFVTGTDTNVGKTVVSALICAALQGSGGSAGYFKPVQTGDDDDTDAISRLAALEPGALAQPVFRLPLPAAPWRAAEAAGTTIQLEQLVAGYKALGDRKWIVEGAGGLLVPLNRRVTLLELVKVLGLPVAVVASTRLGTINHTLLTVRALEHEKIVPSAIILNGEPDPGLKETIAAFTEVPILAEIPKLPSLERVPFAKAALDLFPPRVLSRLFGPVTGMVGG